MALRPLLVGSVLIVACLGLSASAVVITAEGPGGVGGGGGGGVSPPSPTRGCPCGPAPGSAVAPSTAEGAVRLSPVAPTGSLELQKAWESWMISSYQRETEKMGERREAMRVSNFMGWVAFAATHLVLAIALWASWQEFRAATKVRAKAGGKPGDQAQPQNEITLGLDGIALRTSLHGIFLLGIAAGFYFLFLRFVLPVTIVGP
jgi:hypothetical protein